MRTVLETVLDEIDIEQEEVIELTGIDIANLKLAIQLLTDSLVEELRVKSDLMQENAKLEQEKARLEKELEAEKQKHVDELAIAKAFQKQPIPVPDFTCLPFIYDQFGYYSPNYGYPNLITQQPYTITITGANTVPNTPCTLTTTSGTINITTSPIYTYNYTGNGNDYGYTSTQPDYLIAGTQCINGNGALTSQTEEHDTTTINGLGGAGDYTASV